MSQDTPYSNPENPYSPAMAGGTQQSKIIELFRPLYDRRHFMTLIGVLTMIGGILYCLTIIGAIFGVPAVIMGNSLRKAAASLEEGNNTGNASAFYEANSGIGLFFFIAGIFTAIGLLLNLVVLAFMVLGVAIG